MSDTDDSTTPCHQSDSSSENPDSGMGNENRGTGNRDGKAGNGEPSRHRRLKERYERPAPRCPEPRGKKTLSDEISAAEALKNVANRAKWGRLEGEILRRSQALSPSGKAMFETYPGRKSYRIDHSDSDGRIILVPITDTNPVNKYRVYGLYLDDAPEELVYAWKGTRKETAAKGTVKTWLNTKEGYADLREAIGNKPWHVFTLKTGTQAECKNYVTDLKKQRRMKLSSIQHPGTSAALRKKMTEQKNKVRAEADLVRLNLHKYVRHMGYDDRDVNDIFWHLWQVASVDEIVEAVQQHYGIDPTDAPEYAGVRPGNQQGQLEQ